ncbi:glycosyltransferase family 2 protein [Arthrobacter vasquezii]|nr:glycosyltransferase family 2 protein [Arthrobacter vasquezii]
MPAYNAGGTVETAILTTLRAMPSDSELVVVDDASQDHTATVLEQLSNRDKRVRVVTMKTNCGIAEALAQGMKVSDSKYIARMDADDIALPWKFSQGFGQLSSGADICFSTVTVFQKGLHVRPSLPVSISGAAMRLSLLVVNPVAHPTMLARREAIEASGGYRQVASEDYDLWMRAATAGYKLVRSSFPGLLYRRHAGQITAQHSWKLKAMFDEETARAHSDLTKVVLGREFSVYRWLRGDRNSNLREEVEEFFSLLYAEAKQFRGLERAVLMRQTDRAYGRGA